MNDLERELVGALARAADAGVPEPVRLRNPALSQPSARGRSRAPGSSRRRWVVLAAAGMTMAVVAAVIAPIWNSRDARRVAPAGPSATATATATPPAGVGTPHGDGSHPLWHLTVPAVPSRRVDQLPMGSVPDIPKPYTLDPWSSSGVVSKPTLVTTDGRVEFTDPGTVAILLLGTRPQGVFVATVGPCYDAKGTLCDVRIYLVGKGNVRRQVYSGVAVSSLTVSPDGTTLAVSTWLKAGVARSVDVLSLVDVATGRITHQLTGRYAQVTWLGDATLLLVGPGTSPRTQVWRAPWTATTPDTVDLGITAAFPTATGLLGVDQNQGCLKRLDSSLRVIEASCGGWTVETEPSPDRRYIPVAWHPSGAAAARAGVLDVTTNQVSPWPVDAGSPTWVGAGEPLLLPQSGNTPDRARCTLASGTCVRVPDSSLSELFRAASWSFQD